MIEQLHVFRIRTKPIWMDTPMGLNHKKWGDQALPTCGERGLVSSVL